MRKERYTALRLGKERRRRPGPLVGLLIEGSGYRPFHRILNCPGGDYTGCVAAKARPFQSARVRTHLIQAAREAKRDKQCSKTDLPAPSLCPWYMSSRSASRLQSWIFDDTGEEDGILVGRDEADIILSLCLSSKC